MQPDELSAETQHHHDLGAVKSLEVPKYPEHSNLALPSYNVFTVIISPELYYSQRRRRLRGNQ
jgi:hypothetical protein